MIFLKRRRLLLWLLKAYVKKWRKTILLSFFLGLIVFTILYFTSGFFLNFSGFKEKEKIGILGSYAVNNLPFEVVGKIGRGLTQVSNDGTPLPDVASSWDIKDNGKTYIFHLKQNLYFTDKSRVVSDSINYSFIDVQIQRPDLNTIVFKLKEPYAPFLITVSKPILKQSLRSRDLKEKFIGISDYRVGSVDLNGEFVESIDLVSAKDNKKTLSFQFYPSENALKMAFILGEVSKISGIRDVRFLNTTLYSFANFQIEKRVNYSQLVTLFYNTQDKTLSDKRLREALSYSVSDNFADGKRNRLPFSPFLWASFAGLETYQQDLPRAEELLKDSSIATKSASLTLTIKTLRAYEKTALEIKKSWSVLGIKTNIEIVEALPSAFQVFLGEFNVPQDPDQYSLWHSIQQNNITRYKNLRIDKLLEDGRQTIDQGIRKKIYADFQKYILDDPPATFLFFPYSYTVSRR